MKLEGLVRADNVDEPNNPDSCRARCIAASGGMFRYPGLLVNLHNAVASTRHLDELKQQEKF